MKEPRRVAFRLCAAGIAGWLVAAGSVAARQEYAIAREIWLLQATGWASLAALFLALSSTPLARLVRFAGSAAPRPPVVGAFRRAFGISAALLALLHAGVALQTYLAGNWAAALGLPRFRSGVLAVAILTAMLATSFPRVVQLAGIGLWKELHWLGFAALLAVLHHLLLSPFAPRALTLGLFGGLALIGALRLLPARGLRREPAAVEAPETPSPRGK